MKEKIHPTYFADAKIKCACGKVHSIGSTVKEIHIEICSNCHPFYTGKDKLVDTAGRVDRFKRLVSKREEVSKVRIGKKAKRAKASARKVSKVKDKK